MYYILDKNKRPVVCDDLLKWGDWMFAEESWEKSPRRVAQTQVGKYFVSTIFLGLDFGLGLSERPQLFETLIQGPKGSEMRRYSTWAEAEEGHLLTCAALEVSEGLDKAENFIGCKGFD